MPLYHLSVSIPAGSRATAFGAFGMMDAEADKKDAGKCTLITRVMDLCGNCFVVVDGPSHADVLSWAYNWCTLCDITVTPVLNDEDARAIIK